MRADRNSHHAHQQLLAKAKTGGIDLYFLGDSITRRWGATDYPDFLAHWNETFHGWNAGNFGWGGDRTENILWRLSNGELDGVDPKVIVLLAGTNNIGKEPGDDAKVADVTRGLQAIVDTCRKKAPEATIVLTAIFPRNDSRAGMPAIARINAHLARMADGESVRFLDVNAKLAGADGTLFEGMMPDGLHPSLKGYEVWAEGLRPILTELLGPPAATDHAPPPTGDPSAAELSEQWVDPVTDAPPGTTYRLFETASRGKGTKGSYLIYLPPSYETETARRYPVVYWLHGGFGNARQGAWAVQHLDEGIRAGRVPETIVVLPQALPVGWYVNSKDGRRPIEDVFIKDLVPHVDATWRTLARRESRGIEGMSMGGYGALHLGMKYPSLFGAISAVAPSILRDLKDEPKERTFDTFGDDEAYYDANGPWALARENAAALRRGGAIRLLAGDRDARLRATLVDFHELLTQLGIPHQFSEVKGAGHVYEDIVGGLGDEGFAFWRRAFSASVPGAAAP
jgi:enterochelin esterase-like enzyme/lysophospholipase L1-like esterase